MQDASQISKSTVTEENRFSKDLVLGKASKLDVIFPYFDYVTRQKDWWKFIKTIVVFFVALQDLFISSWIWCGFYDGMDRNITDEIGKILLGMKPTGNASNGIASTIIFFVASLVSAIIIIFVNVYYTKNRRFVKWTVVIMELFLESIIPLMIQPVACAFSVLLGDIITNGPATLTILFIILALIILIYLVLVNDITIKLIARSATKHHNLTTYFDSRVMRYTPLINIFAMVGQKIFCLFPSWSILLIMILHLFCCAYITYIILNFGFHSSHTQSFFAATHISMGLMDITMFCLIMFPMGPEYIPFIFSLGYVFLGCFILEPTYSFLIKKMASQLNYEDGVPLDDETLTEHFRSLGLDKNDRTVINYIRVGFTNICDTFLDFSLFNFIVQNSTHSNRIITEMVSILAYFPGETRKMNLLFNILVNRRDLSTDERFLIYQVYKIKTTRQSSVSADISERFANLKKISRMCENEVAGFWNMTEPSLGYLEYISSQFQYLDMLWQEAINDYPNNAKINDEYSRFLTECTANFNRAAYHHLKCDMIEKGRSFTVDHAFIALVQSYPKYLKEKHIDFRGFIISKIKAHRKTGSQTSTQSKQDSSLESSFNTQLDPEVEDMITKQFMSQSKVRLTLHHALQNRRSKYSKALIIVVPIITVITVAIAGIIVFLVSKRVRISSEMIQNIRYASVVRYSLAITQGQITMRGANASGKVVSDLVDIKSVIEEDGSNIKDFYALLKIDDLINEQLKVSEEALTNLIKSVNNMANQGWPVYDIASILLKSNVNMNTCVNMKSTSNSSQPMSVASILHIWTQFDLLTANPANYQKDNNRYCESTLASFQLDNAGDILAESLANYEDMQTNYIIQFARLLKALIPLSMFVISSIPSSVIVALFIVEQRSVMKMFLSMPHKAKEDCKRPIMKGLEDELLPTEPKNSTNTIWLFIVIYLVVGAAFSLITLDFLNTATETALNINKLNKWMMYSSRRSCYAASNVHMAMQMIVGHNPNGPPSLIISSYGLRGRLTAFTKRMEDANIDLCNGENDTNPCFGFDDELDKLNYQEACELENNETDFHDTYKCASASGGISVLRTQLMETISKFTGWGGKIREPVAIHMIHNAGAHLYNRLTMFNDKLTSLSTSSNNELRSYWMASIGIASGVCIIQAIITFLLYMKMRRIFSALMAFVKHTTPIHLINNRDLVDYLLNRKASLSDEVMGVAQTVIYGSSDAIFCTGLNGIVETVNSSVTTDFGYTPEQILGQPFASILKDTDAESLSRQLELMVSGQTSSVYEGSCVILSDSAAEIQCAITVLGMTLENNGPIDSYVMIVRDETEIRIQRKRAEMAKAQSESLLYQILPRDIVSMLNRGEKDISFSVPSASIVFIDVNRFSEYCAILSPEDIMGSLSTISGTFDEIIKKYPLMTKIKLIGDIYMAAAGLFCGPDDPPKAHAEQTVYFALDCIQALEEVNLKLNAGLQVRVGINTGGPLIAGVLGTDKPVFDIIGDPINVAARLQTTDLPNNVQISQATKELLADSNDFQIEQRGEVYLKGKGNQMTYFVSIPTNFMASLSSYEIPKFEPIN